MSSARLEIINDDADTPACMSRSMPAALEGLVTPAALDDFCDKLDALFVLSHTESQRVKQRSIWTIRASFFYFLCVCVGIFLFQNMNALVFSIFSSGTSAIWVLNLGIVWLCTQPGAGTMSQKEILQLIRCACDELIRCACVELTRSAPFVLSFHVAAGAISHIRVSISASASATASGVASASNATMDETSDSKIAESTDNHHPVVHAQFVTTRTTTNGDNQQLSIVEVV
jgi:hypothetical protein